MMAAAEKVEFKTVDEHFRKDNASGQPCMYYGKKGDWLVVYGQHRDSEQLVRSNFRSILKALGGESRSVAIERFGHWAVGWVESILVSPGAKKKLERAQEVMEALRDYPVVDEEDYSQMQWDEFMGFAEGELKGYDGWEKVLREEMDKSNSGPGDDHAEWEIIEAARKRLKEAENGKD